MIDEQCGQRTKENESAVNDITVNQLHSAVRSEKTNGRRSLLAHSLNVGMCVLTISIKHGPMAGLRNYLIFVNIFMAKYCTTTSPDYN